MFMWRVWRASSPEAKASGAAEFWAEFAKFLKKHNEILKKKADEGRGPFYGGSKPALPDVFAFTWLNRWITGWIPCPEGAITEDKYLYIWKLWKGVRESKGIKEYFESGRWSLAE
jgi:glutathione S-transferase